MDPSYETVVEFQARKLACGILFSVLGLAIFSRHQVDGNALVLDSLFGEEHANESWIGANGIVQFHDLPFTEDVSSVMSRSSAWTSTGDARPVGLASFTVARYRPERDPEFAASPSSQQSAAIDECIRALRRIQGGEDAGSES